MRRHSNLPRHRSQTRVCELSEVVRRHVLLVQLDCNVWLDPYSVVALAGLTEHRTDVHLANGSVITVDAAADATITRLREVMDGRRP